MASKVNGQVIRGVTSLRTRVWLTRNVNRVQSRLPKNIFGKGKLAKNKKGWRWGDEKIISV